MNLLKRSFCSLPLILALALAAGLVETGCTTSSQRTAYNSIATVEGTASTAVDGYYALVIRGVVPTNQVPVVSQRFNQLQAGLKIAAAASQLGTNSVAPENLVQESLDLIAFVSTLTK